MKVCVLASGSEGNSTFISTENHKILIDIGKNVKYITEKLKEICFAHPTYSEGIFEALFR